MHLVAWQNHDDDLLDGPLIFYMEKFSCIHFYTIYIAIAIRGFYYRLPQGQILSFTIECHVTLHGALRYS
jgi:hypothetical protein